MSPTDSPPAQSDETTPTKPRRFVPEVVETTTKSSSKTNRRNDHSPAEGENASKSAKVRGGDSEPNPTRPSSLQSQSEKDGDTPKPRRFVPQVTEVTHKSSKDRGEPEVQPGHVRFIPQPMETTYRSNRTSASGNGSQSSADTSMQSETKEARKWAPEMLNTAKRSRRAGVSHETSEDFRTEQGHNLHAREHQKHIAGHANRANSNPVIYGSGESGHGAADPSKVPPEMRRQIAPLDGSSGSRSSSLNQSRTSSFRCPDLETIESSGSDCESDHSSPSCSPGRDSAITASESSSFHDFHKYATRSRESVDEHFGNYLLQLEARRAQEKLQEEALAAFPNSDFHEPVQHYVNDDHDSEEFEDRPVTWEAFEDGEDIAMSASYRRESTRVPWEREEAQRHAEQQELERRANQTTAKKLSASPWWNAAPRYVSPRRPDNEIRSMRDRARPPMLGDELVFPRSASPEHARFDVTQGSCKYRREMCSLTDGAQAKMERSEDGLWNTSALTAQSTVYYNSRSSTNNTPNKKCLWGGFCVQNAPNSIDHNELQLLGTSGGLITPNVEHNIDPFSQSFAGHSANPLQRPPTPPTETDSPANTHDIDIFVSEPDDLDDQIERDFPDSFVTQVYNYLSLGYPALARPFDDELAKVSGIAVSALREDDVRAKASPRGYIRLTPDFEGGASRVHDGRNDSEETVCVRWTALRLYVREWAKQEKTVAGFDASGENWGAAARRGSWGL